MVKLKTKSSQRIDTCKYKIDTDSDDNIMPIRKYKVHFPHTESEINKCTIKVVLHAYNSSCIPQMGKC